MHVSSHVWYVHIKCILSCASVSHMAIFLLHNTYWSLDVVYRKYFYCLPEALYLFVYMERKQCHGLCSIKGKNYASYLRNYSVCVFTKNVEHKIIANILTISFKHAYNIATICSVHCVEYASMNNDAVYFMCTQTYTVKQLVYTQACQSLMLCIFLKIIIT